MDFFLKVFCLLIMINGFETKNNPETGRKVIRLIVVLSFIIIFLLLITAILVIKWVFSPPNTKSEVQESLVMCRPNQSKYQYLISFNIGCASDNFDWNKTNIDIEMLCSDNTAIGQQIRFTASKLIDPIDSYMKIFMSRVTPMPRIKSINSSHNGTRNSKIFLYCVKVYELSEYKPIDTQFMKILDYIEFKPKRLMEYNERRIRYPEVPTKMLTCPEVIVVLFMSTSLIAIAVHLFLYWISLEFAWIPKLALLILVVSLSSMTALLFQSSYLFVYKYVIKWNLCKDKCLQSEGKTKTSKSISTLIFTNCLAVIISLVFIAITCQLVWCQTGIKRNHEIYWFIAVITSMSIVFGTWFLFSRTHSQNKEMKSLKKEKLSSIDSLMATSEDSSVRGIESITIRSLTNKNKPKNSKKLT